MVVTGAGFPASQDAVVTNETTGATVCAATTGSDGTFTCAGTAGATAGSNSDIGVGAATAPYRAIGSAEIATVAGGGTGIACGGTGAPALEAHTVGIDGVATDPSGDLYFSEPTVVCKLNTVTGVVSLFAGNPQGKVPYGGDGGPATSAELSQAEGLVVYGHYLYIADYQNERVRRVDLSTGIITTVAGDGTMGVTGNGGPATAAEIASPWGLAVDEQGNVYISGGGGVRELNTTTGVITSVEDLGGSGIAIDSADRLFIAAGGLYEYDLTSPPAQPLLVAGAGTDLQSVAVDNHGNVFVSGQLTEQVRRVHLSSGVVNAIAGTGVAGYGGDGGPATEAGLIENGGIAVDSADDLFIGQIFTKTVREVVGGPALTIATPEGTATVFDGTTDGPFRITEEDAAGNPVDAPAAGTVVTMASTSPTGKFAAFAAGPPVSDITIPGGGSSASFYYGDTTAGTPWLTASGAGYGTRPVPATILGPPSAPLGVVAAAGPESASVGWLPPSSTGGSPITGYTATVAPGGATCTVASPAGSPCTVSGLTDGLSYTFTVTATNALGTGPSSAPSNAVVPEGVPGPPLTVSVRPGNDTAIVSFVPPASDGSSPITSYTATATDATTPSNGGQSATGPGSPLTVTGLTEGNRYVFTVTAANGVGQGPASAPSNSIVAATVPGPPVDVGAAPGSGQVLLGWGAPASNGGAPITGYDIFIGTRPNGESTTPLAGSPVTTLGSFVTGLTNGTTYYFKIEAVNTVGVSRPSQETSVTPSPIAFVPVPGSALDISQGADGAVWVIGTNNVPGGHGIYYWNGAGWSGIPGGGVTIATGPDGSPWVINSNHDIFHATQSGWTPYPGAASDIAVGANGAVWVIGTNNVPGGHGIYYWNGTGWSGLPGGGVTIATGPDGTPWVINSKHQIFHWNGKAWIAEPGSANDIAVGADGSVWVIGTMPRPGGYGIYYRNGSGWAEVAGAGVTITAGPTGRPSVTTLTDAIYAG